ncbi:hypothetical protein IU483_30355 [Streptomyces gardneri]|nr:hypothetical protein [Streptomyces gardneri]
MIYLPNPSIGVRGMLHRIVASLGHRPAYHTAVPAPETAETLAAEAAERGRLPIVAIDEAHLLDSHQLLVGSYPAAVANISIRVATQLSPGGTDS